MTLSTITTSKCDSECYCNTYRAPESKRYLIPWHGAPHLAKAHSLRIRIRPMLREARSGAGGSVFILFGESHLLESNQVLQPPLLMLVLPNCTKAVSVSALLSCAALPKRKALLSMHGICIGSWTRASALGWPQLCLQVQIAQGPASSPGALALLPGLWKGISEPQKIKIRFLKRKKGLGSGVKPQCSFQPTPTRLWWLEHCSACSLQKQGEMSPAWDWNSCEILRSLESAPKFIADRLCCSSQTSGFDVKSQTLQASESEHRGPLMLPITGELCVRSEITVQLGAVEKERGSRWDRGTALSFSCASLQRCLAAPRSH
ncbi:uncharacterized protein LOC128853631 [Cuculus canorus]|uniref:uncharacterized protein LOC128853631 n=1 Tax=Cuculus canorus TaxID=55661 RepID=UPI0023AAAC96|nr:uncharacterized protein LOC128853631 [Cuculus canorus]